MILTHLHPPLCSQQWLSVAANMQLRPWQQRSFVAAERSQSLHPSSAAGHLLPHHSEHPVDPHLGPASSDENVS